MRFIRDRCRRGHDNVIAVLGEQRALSVQLLHPMAELKRLLRNEKLGKDVIPRLEVNVIFTLERGYKSIIAIFNHSLVQTGWSKVLVHLKGGLTLGEGD